jgi:hypothetical protein
MDKDVIKNGIVHFANKEIIIQSSGRVISIFNSSGSCIILVKLPMALPRDLHFGIPLLKRLLRSNAKEVIYDESTGRIIIIREASVYLIQESNYILIGTIDGDAPLFNSHCIFNGIIYFGQYDQNQTRSSSKIYKIDRSNNISVAYTFYPGEIRHVHSITLDPYMENRIWITTGDNNGECMLLYTDDDFENIFNIGDKSQDYRIVNLGFSKENLFYGTDNLLSRNYVYQQNRADGKRKKVLSIKQTCWFLKQDQKGNVVLGTTVENGKGCQVNYSSVYFSRDHGWNWVELLRIPKDVYPMPLFKWGSVCFSNGAVDLNDVFINAESLKYLSGKCFNLGYLVNFSDDDLRRIEVKKKDYFEGYNHLMLVIYRLFSLYENTQDLRYLNLLLKLIDWMPIHLFSQKRELRIKAMKQYESISNCTN